VSAAETDMDSCRGAEVNLVKAKADKQKDLTDITAHYAQPQACAPTSTSADPTDLSAMVGCVSNAAEYICDINQRLADKNKLFQAAVNTHSEKKNMCDLAQSHLESELCIYESRLTVACSTHDPCWANAQQASTAAQVRAKEDESRLEFDYTAKTHIVCLLDIISKGDDVSTTDLNKGLLHCKGANIDTSHLTISYPTPPIKDVCDTSPVASKPCGNEWLWHKYQSKSWHTLSTTPGTREASCTACSVAGEGQEEEVEEDKEKKDPGLEKGRKEAEDEGVVGFIKSYEDRSCASETDPQSFTEINFVEAPVEINGEMYNKVTPKVCSDYCRFALTKSRAGCTAFSYDATACYIKTKEINGKFILSHNRDGAPGVCYYKQ